MDAVELLALKAGDRVIIAGRTGEYPATITKAMPKTVQIENGKRFSRATGAAQEYSFSPSKIVRRA